MHVIKVQMTSKVEFRITVGVPVIDRISEAVKNGDEETFSELIAVFKYYESANLNQLDRVSHFFHTCMTVCIDSIPSYLSLVTGPSY